MWGDESEAVAPIIWLYQTVDARKEEVFFPDLLITLRRHASTTSIMIYKSIIIMIYKSIMKMHHITSRPNNVMIASFVVEHIEADWRMHR